MSPGSGGATLPSPISRDQLARSNIAWCRRRPAGRTRPGDQRAVVRVVDAGRAVVGLGDDRREGGAREGEVHLVADLLQAGLDDRKGDGVERAHGALPPRCGDCRSASTRRGGARLDHRRRVDLLEDRRACDRARRAAALRASKTGASCQRAVGIDGAALADRRRPRTLASRGRRHRSARPAESAARRPITEVLRLTSTARISGSRTWKRAK